MKLFIGIFWTNVKAIVKGDRKAPKRYDKVCYENWHVRNYEL